MPKIKSIKKIGVSEQKCIKVDAEDGLFVLDNGLITHNSSDFIMRLYNDGKARVRSRLQTSKKDPITGDKIISYFGRALSYDEEVITSNGHKKMKDIIVGDNLKTPEGYSEVDCIPFDEEDDLYEIELSNGKTIKCNLNHIWPCINSQGKKLLTTCELLNMYTEEEIYLIDYENQV